MITTLDGKLSYDKLQLRVYAPFGHEYNPMGLSGEPVRQTLPSDAMCPVGSTAAGCTDPNRLSRLNREDVYDRYAVAEYRTRFAQDKASLAVRAYVQQFVRGFEPLQILSASPTVPGGLSFKADLTSYRTGAAFDGDVELSPRTRMLYGAEAFHEWKPDQTSGSLQGDGTPFTLTSPAPNLVPLPCPRDPTGQAVVRVPADLRVPGGPHRARRLRRPAVPAEQGADLRPRRPRPGRARRAREPALRPQHHVRGHRGLELHPELAPQGQLRPGLPAPGVQQHDVEW